MNSKAEKLHKKALLHQQRRIKPKECQKYVRIVLDNSFLSSNFGRELLKHFKDSNTNHETRNIGENCIYWERNAAQREFISNDNLAMFNDEWQKEKHVIKLFKAHELKLHVQQKTLSVLIKEFRAFFPENRLTIIVPRFMEKGSDIAEDHAEAYVELQLMEDVAVVEIKPTAQDVVAFLLRFTKAIAEAPYKQQKYEVAGAFKKYVANDKKQCVRVKGTTGFDRLWQQHLNRLPMVTKDVAEGIIARYSCPKKLIKAYRDNEKVVDEIADIRLNRGIGPQAIQNQRRIGNVLSTKVHTLYNSRDPNECI